MRLTNFGDKDATLVEVTHDDMVDLVKRVYTVISTSDLPNDPATHLALVLFVMMQVKDQNTDGTAANAIKNMHLMVDAVGANLKDRP